ncbi:site-2 protease family protein [Armatimonas sp.]|uniref:site-2 protease family protein n=1 Tax=Armatimonas sp. TaxID=1872638 RepID=UPI00286CE2F2|nr:site-2 protease family protein [Armatimonas sp.]
MNLILQLLLIYSAYLVLIAAHEGGHALAIRRVGYHWQSCQIGPLLLEPTRRPQFSGTLFGGKITYTTLSRKRLFHHDFWVIIGGILMNLLIVIATSTLFSFLPPSQRAQEWLLPMVSTLSLGMVIGSFLPFSQRYVGLDSDGLQLLRLLSKKKHY